MPTLIDTHVWLWWVTVDARLSKKAKVAIGAAQHQGDLWISLISFWEIAKKVEKKQLVLDRPLDQWLDTAAAAPGLHTYELTRSVLTESCRLPQPFHGDPADQLIVATVRHHGAVLITKDEKIRNYPYIRSIW